MPDRELGEQWAKAFRATVAQPDEERFRLAEQDLFAEHQLRRIQPPYEQISACRENLVVQLIAKMNLLGSLEAEALERKVPVSSDRSFCEVQLKLAQDAIARGRARVAKQRAMVRSLKRRHSPETRMAREALQELERSLALSEKSRDHYTGLLRRWS